MKCTMRSDPLDARNWSLCPVEQFDVKESYRKDLAGILIPSGKIEERVKQLAYEVSQDYTKPPLAVCMMTGALKFYGDLVMRMNIPVTPEYLTATSQAGTESKGKVDFHGFDFDVMKDQDVVIVEDIKDTGLTLRETVNESWKAGAASVKVVTAFDKPARKKHDIGVEPHIGITIPDKYVVGYWLDFKGRYRDIAHLCVLKPEIFQ